LLQVYAATPQVVRHLLEHLMHARCRGSRGGRKPPAPTEPSQLHFLTHVEACGVLPMAHLRAAFACILDGLTFLIEPDDATPDEARVLSGGAVQPYLEASPTAPEPYLEVSQRAVPSTRASSDCRLLALQVR
jgi:hypothetical protein